MDHVTWDDKVMSDEIFGPIMPILTFTNLEETLSLINKKDKPLAFYYFSKNEAKGKHVLAISPFGGGCFNDTIMHLTNDDLPFGGVGRSGMGSYHAIDSRREGAGSDAETLDLEDAANQHQNHRARQTDVVDDIESLKFPTRQNIAVL